MGRGMKRVWVCLVFALVLFASIVWTVWGNVSLKTSVYKIRSERLPEAFDGYTIAQVSDLHNAEFGKENERLLSALRKTECDMLVLTGDLVDSRRTDIGIAVDFAREAVKIAPTYYVSGNHEARLTKEYPLLKSGLLAAGVTVLENEEAYVEKNGERLKIVGLQDPNFLSGGSKEDKIENSLKEFVFGQEYTIVLAHRPDLFDVYANAGADLAFSGHAHGGQFRLPFVGGLYAPGQGFFPKYDAGLYTKENTKMLVSRGLGNSAFPFRLNNRPQIVVAKLEKI